LVIAYICSLTGQTPQLRLQYAFDRFLKYSISWLLANPGSCQHLSWLCSHLQPSPPWLQQRLHWQTLRLRCLLLVARELVSPVMTQLWWRPSSMLHHDNNRVLVNSQDKTDGANAFIVYSRLCHLILSLETHLLPVPAQAHPILDCAMPSSSLFYQLLSGSHVW
jgi:hypothetical protein